MMKDRTKLVVFASIIAIVVSCGLLAIPQFIIPSGFKNPTLLNGYQFFFHLGGDNYNATYGASSVSGLGIACLVVMVLALASYALYKLSSALVLLGGLLNVASAIMFFAMSASKDSVYGVKRNFVYVGWTNYVIGALLILTGLLSIYVAIRLFMQEKKQLSDKQSYSYLKK